MRVGVLVWPPYETLFLARDLGYYDEGEIQLVDFETPAEVLRAYQNGVIDIVALTADFLLQTAAGDPSHRAILVIDSSLGGDALIARPEFETVADLRGKRVGVEMSALGQHVLTRALESGGLVDDDVELRFVDVADQAEAFQLGEVDAVVTYEPVRTVLLAEDGRLLFDSTAIPDEIVDLLICRHSLIERREAVLSSLVDGYFEALDFLRRQPDEAAERVAKREGLSKESFLAALELVEQPDREANRAWLTGSSPRLIGSMKKVQQVLLDNDDLSEPHELRSLIDGRFVAREPD